MDEETQGNANDHVGEASGVAAIGAGLSQLLEVIWGKVQEREEVARWFSQWVPLLASLQELGMTLASVAMAVRARVDEREEPYLDDEELEHLKMRLVEILEASPDAAELIFGLENVDEAIEDILEDEESRSAVATILGGLERQFDGVIQRLVAWATGAETPDITPDQVRAFLDQVQDVLQEAVDRWLLPMIIDSELKRGDS